MELTQEYFDQQLGNLATKADLEHLASKADFNALKLDVSELKTDVMDLKTDMQSVKTNIVALHDDVRSVKSTLKEMNQTLIALDKRDKEDSDAFAKTLVNHGERLNIVEEELKKSGAKTDLNISELKNELSQAHFRFGKMFIITLLKSKDE